MYDLLISQSLIFVFLFFYDNCEFVNLTLIDKYIAINNLQHSNICVNI
jgi:hypothetical protein